MWRNKPVESVDLLSTSLLFVFFMISCKNNTSISKYVGKVPYDSVKIRVVPDSITSGPIEKSRQWFENVLGLASLKHGYENMQMRVYEENQDYSGHIIIVKDSVNNWVADLVKYKTIYLDTNKKAISFQHFSLGKPKSGWEQFVKKLNGLEIRTLRDYHLIPGYSIDADELSVLIEVAEKNKYMLNMYPNPYVREQIPEAKKIVKILKLIKDEFPFHDQTNDSK